MTTKTNMLRVTLKKSPIGYNARQRKTVVGLGLKKVNSSKVLKDTPPIRGMISKVSHLVNVEDC
ncbi:MAG: 50S ribosomal protein L30 [Deltaproteobacteria bacterium]|nr:50S ribosomal protein L30 [Deltaproteobacteria bacterium]